VRVYNTHTHTHTNTLTHSLSHTHPHSLSLSLSPEETPHLHKGVSRRGILIPFTVPKPLYFHSDKVAQPVPSSPSPSSHTDSLVIPSHLASRPTNGACVRILETVLSFCSCCPSVIASPAEEKTAKREDDKRHQEPRLTLY